jgi:hypothetical protein
MFWRTVLLGSQLTGGQVGIDGETKTHIMIFINCHRYETFFLTFGFVNTQDILLLFCFVATDPEIAISHPPFDPGPPLDRSTLAQAEPPRFQSR